MSMRTGGCIVVGICVAFAFVAAVRRHPSRPSRYTVTDLGTLGGGDTEAYAINDLGQIVGQSDADATIAYSINDRGDIVGNSTYGVIGGSDQNLYDAVLWRSGKPIGLGEVIGYPNSTASKINAQGQVVGQGIDQEDGPAMHIYRSCSARFAKGVGLPTGALPNGFTLNDRGQCCGSIVRNRRRIFVLWQGERVLARTVLASPQHLVDSSLNNRGQAALTVSEWDSDDPYPPGPITAELWTKEVMHRLPALPGYPNAYTKGINDSGQVVGEVIQDDRRMTSRPLTRAVLWESGIAKDLNTLIPEDSGWRLAVANGINNRGQLVGWGTYQSQRRAFMLTPGGAVTAP